MIRHSHQQLILCCRLSRGGGISSSASCRHAAAAASCTSQHLAAPHHDFRQHRYMQTDTTTAAATISNRSDFKSTPIIPSILSHIERIGVGIRPKPSRKKRRTPPSKGGHGDNSAHTLDEVEEREYFRQGRMTSRHANSSQRGNVKKTDAKHGKWQNKNNKHRDGKKTRQTRRFHQQHHHKCRDTLVTTTTLFHIYKRHNIHNIITSASSRQNTRLRSLTKRRITP